MPFYCTKEKLIRALEIMSVTLEYEVETKVKDQKYARDLLIWKTALDTLVKGLKRPYQKFKIKLVAPYWENLKPIQKEGNIYELWDFFIQNKGFLKNDLIYQIVWLARPKLNEECLWNVVDLLYSIDIDSADIPLQSIFPIKMSPLEEAKRLDKMRAFLDIDNSESDLEFDDFSKYIIETIGFTGYSDPSAILIKEGKNFFQLLVDNIKAVKNSYNCARMIKLLVEHTSEFDWQYELLLSSMNSLNSNMVMKLLIDALPRMIYSAHSDLHKVYEVIRDTKLKQAIKIQLFELLLIKPYKFDSQVFELTSGNATHLIELFTEPIMRTDILNNNLLIGPKAPDGYIRHGSKLYSQDELFYCLDRSKKDPYTRQKVDEKSYKQVDSSLLQPLVSNIVLEQQSVSNIDSVLQPPVTNIILDSNKKTEIKNPHAIARHIIFEVPIDIGYKREKDKIDDITQLGVYYDYLASIKVLYMMTAENDKGMAVELLTKSLSGEKLPEPMKKKCDLAFIRLRLHDSEIEEEPLQSYISNTADPQEFLQSYEIMGESTNLFVDCMQILKKPDSGIEKLIVCGKLVWGMFEKIQFSSKALKQLSNFVSYVDDTTLHLVILAIYTLIGKNNNNDNLLTDIIDNLQTILSTLIEVSEPNFSIANIAGETIFYPKLGRYFADNPNLKKILDAQKTINAQISPESEIEFDSQKIKAAASESIRQNKCETISFFSKSTPNAHRQEERPMQIQESLEPYIENTKKIYFACIQSSSDRRKISNSNFNIKTSNFSDNERLVYYICKLIVQLHKGRLTLIRKNLIKELYECMYPDTAVSALNKSVLELQNENASDQDNWLLSGDQAKKSIATEGLKPILEKAKANPCICIKASESCIAKLMHWVYHLLDWSNSDRIEEIEWSMKPQH